MLDILCYRYNPVRFSSQISNITATGQDDEFTSTDIIRGGIDETNKYATFEPNGWRLDGTYSLYDEKKFSYWSDSPADNDGNLSDKSITIEFKNEITLSEISGVTVVADPTTPILGIKCLTYNNDDLVSSYTHAGQKNIYQCNFTANEEAKITKVVLKLTKALPGKKLKIKNIFFGSSETITEDMFYDVQVLEEISIASDRIPANTLSFTLTATQAYIDVLQQLYRCFILLKDGVQFGSFYLDNVEKQNDNKFTLSCVDIIGILENIPYNDNLFISTENSNVTIQDVLNTIFEGIDCNYTLSGFNESAISIKLQSLTKREALTHLLLSTNAVCKKLRNGSLAISRLDTVVKRDITGNIYTNYKVVDNTPTSSISMSKVALAKGPAMSTSGLSTYIAERGNDYVVIGVELPELVWAPTAQMRLSYTVSFRDEYGEFAIVSGLRTEKDATSFTSTHYIDGKVSVASNVILFKIDTDVLTTLPNEYRQSPEHYEVSRGRFYSRGTEDWQWYNPYISDRIKNADWSTLTIYKTSVTALHLDTVTLENSSEISMVTSPNEINALKTQDLQIQTVQIAGLVINGTMELGETTETAEIPVTDSSGQDTEKTETVTNTIPINLILTKLMERYYRYNKVFEGKILAEGLHCGDTVSMTLPYIGYVTGTIQKLEYNLTNKEIADTSILLYI